MCVQWRSTPNPVKICPHTIKCRAAHKFAAKSSNKTFIWRKEKSQRFSHKNQMDIRRLAPANGKYFDVRNFHASFADFATNLKIYMYTTLLFDVSNAPKHQSASSDELQEKIKIATAAAAAFNFRFCSRRRTKI